MVIPILQAKFYYIPPPQDSKPFRELTWNLIPHHRGYLAWCSTIGEKKLCPINSPRVVPQLWWKWNHAISIPHMWRIENFRCNVGMSILYQGGKKIGKIPYLSFVASHSWLMGNLFFTTCGFATTWWKIQSLFLLGEGLGQCPPEIQILNGL